MNATTNAPTTSEEFDKGYRLPITIWGDFRVPKELEELVKTNNPGTSLEFGCGLGRFSRFMVSHGIKATGVDFSSVAIEKAKKRTANDEFKPTYLVGDVTDLGMINEQFDVGFDVGCFHCLDKAGQWKYVSEAFRLLKPGAAHLIWTLASSPSGMQMDPSLITDVFGKHFDLVNYKFSRRRIVASYWFWLVRKK